MQWSGKADFDSTPRDHLRAKGRTAGYVQKADNFAVFTILNSGHMVSQGHGRSVDGQVLGRIPYLDSCSEHFIKTILRELDTFLSNTKLYLDTIFCRHW